jgi:hypothetical protein
MTGCERILSRRDMDFLLNDWLQLDKLLERPRFAEHPMETISAALDLAQELAAKYFGPAQLGRRPRRAAL